jgi:hypothetical protein
MKINIVPFGDVDKDRFELSKRYKLIEKVGEIWRLTAKCRNNYDCISYFKYMQGVLEVPEKLERDKLVKDILSM